MIVATYTKAPPCFDDLFRFSVLVPVSVSVPVFRVFQLPMQTAALSFHSLRSQPYYTCSMAQSGAENCTYFFEGMDMYCVNSLPYVCYFPCYHSDFNLISEK